jgi:3-deoxy-7-phosphoheptulonate synthase
MMPYVDIFQVGARNNQNFSLLKALGSVDRPVLLKRGISGTLEELLNSAEYIYSHGNERILLCERGIRTFEGAYRNVLDINAIPVLKAKSHLPVIVDPSHGIGLRECVEAVGLAGIMAGADGVIVESHARPEEALSDGQQTLNYSESKRFIEKANRVVQLRSELNNVGV